MGALPRSPLATLALAVLAASSLAMRSPSPEIYGQVILDNFATDANVPPAVFDHWRHRALYTCRVCHVDIGFAMTAGATKVSAQTNRGGFHCGACHDGKMKRRGTTVFASCSEARDTGAPACRRCHAPADRARLLKEYRALAQDLPRTATGAIEWEKAEAQGGIRPMDFVEGVSMQRPALKMDKEISVESRGWMSDVLFSHRKHAAWNGCEVCHPEIFPVTRAGAVKYSMLNITGGEYCGVCHLKVAFHVSDCERCHAKPVR